MKTVKIDGENLSLSDIQQFLGDEVVVAADSGALAAVASSAEFCGMIAQKDEAYYGINTGFGALSSKRIEKGSLAQLQKNLLRSHATGMGEHLPEDIVRLMMLLRVNSLLRGYSGVSLAAVTYLIDFLNKRTTPVIPKYGSVGASGDLAPLAHMALPLIGEGEAIVDGKRVSGKEALAAMGLEPLQLQAKEGLALINGTQLMAAFAVRDLIRARQYLKAGVIAASLSVEGYSATDRAFDDRIHQLKSHPGEIRVARSFRQVLGSSEIVKARRSSGSVQDPYSFRCAPQVLGAVLDTFYWVEEWVTREINAVTDNPIIFKDDGDVISGGNFHGEHMAIALDAMAIAMSELASISERRIDKLLDNDIDALPQCLIKEPGLNSGLMVTQYLAASLVSENKVYSHPASVDSIPTSAGFEDHVSMGSISAFKLSKVVDNVAKVIAVELLCAAQAVDWQGAERCGKGSTAAHQVIRQHVPFIEEDSMLSGFLEILEGIVREGSLVQAVESAVGPLLED